jgi:FtsZ-interacting cell division protein ZipA
MNTKTIVLGVSAIAACVAAFATLSYVRSERDKTEKAREATERARDETKQQLAQVRDEREKLDRAKVEAQQQTKSLTDAVDASKQFEQTQREKGKRANRVSTALVTAQQFKITAAEHFQTTGQWPKSNKELGLPSSESFRSDTLRSVSIEPYANTSRIRIRYMHEDSTEREIHLVGGVNATIGAFTWQCSSPDTPDIAEFAQGCIYRAK